MRYEPSLGLVYGVWGYRLYRKWEWSHLETDQVGFGDFSCLAFNASLLIHINYISIQ